MQEEIVKAIEARITEIREEIERLTAAREALTGRKRRGRPPRDTTNQ